MSPPFLRFISFPHKTRLSTIAGILLLCGLLAAIAMSLAAQQQFAIRADVNLVQLHATVTDSKGHTVLGLGKDAFQLFVDDAPQPVTVFQGEDAPVTAGIVIDNSASMAPKRQEVIAAALAFARASNPTDQMFVLHFNKHSRFGLPEGTPFTGTVSDLETAIAAFQLGGTTAFYDALLTAEAQFRSADYSRKVLLTITDGGDNSSRANLTAALDGALKAGVVVYPIGIFDQNDRDRNPGVLSKSARTPGARRSSPSSLQMSRRSALESQKKSDSSMPSVSAGLMMASITAYDLSPTIEEGRCKFIPAQATSRTNC